MIFLVLFLLQDVAALSGQGAAAMREQRYAQAVDIYRKLAASDAANPMWRMNLGIALAYSGEHREAAAELTAFVRARPRPGPAHLVLGLSLLKLDQNCEAIPPLEEALRWRERPNSIWVELGDAYKGCKRWEPAAKAYSEARRLDPRDQRLSRQTARCWWMARRYDQAKTEYTSIESLFRNEPDFQFEYGDTLMRLEGAAAGLPWLEKAVAAEPQLLAAQGALGRAYLELGRPADALAPLTAAAAQDPALLLPLSNAYKALGKPAEASRLESEYKAKMKAVADYPPKP